jgi:uncharacterized protein (DUF2236 family)
MLASARIAVTDTARMLARDVLYPRTLRVASPALSFVRLNTVALLPATIREAYGFTWSRRKETTLRLSANVIRGVLRVTPRSVRHWPAARKAARAHGGRG